MILTTEDFVNRGRVFMGHVFTNGVFDLFHLGHLRILEDAAKYGALFVAVNDDESTARIKPGRPIISCANRMRIVEAIRGVSYVTSFATSNPVPLIEKMQPATYVKGPPWTVEMLPETPIVEGYGGRVVIGGEQCETTTDIIRRCQGKQ